MQTDARLGIGVVIPAYNEGENIVALVQAVRNAMPAATIVVVDDSPNDITVQVLRTAAISSLSCIHRTTKGGRGSAVIEGVAYLRGKGCDVVVEMDADFSHPPTQIPALIDHLAKHRLDLVIAARYLPESAIKNWPLSRRIFSKCSNWLTRYLLEVPVSDYTNGFRVYSARACDIITAECGRRGTGFIPLSEILVSIYYRGLSVGEVPTVFVNRVRGESSLNMKEIKNALIGLRKIYQLKKELQKQTSA